MAKKTPSAAPTVESGNRPGRSPALRCLLQSTAVTRQTRSWLQQNCHILLQPWDTQLLSGQYQREYISSMIAGSLPSISRYLASSRRLEPHSVLGLIKLKNS